MLIPSISPNHNTTYQEIVGLLIMGYTHSMISCSVYSKIRAILTLCNVDLPAWATIQASRKRIQTLLNNRVNVSASPFGTPTFALSPQTLIAQVLPVHFNLLRCGLISEGPHLAGPCIRTWRTPWSPLTWTFILKHPKEPMCTNSHSHSSGWKVLLLLTKPQMCEVKMKHF
jgi:hypothetical protein